MSREEATANAVEVDLATTPRPSKVRSSLAGMIASDALAAADAHDHAHGIHRIALDDATVERAADILLQGDMGMCECRRSPFDKHDVNPPCSTRKAAIEKMRCALEAAAPFIRAQALEDAADEFSSRLPDGTGNGRAYNSYRVAELLRARAVTERGGE